MSRSVATSQDESHQDDGRITNHWHSRHKRISYATLTLLLE